MRTLLSVAFARRGLWWFVPTLIVATTGGAIAGLYWWEPSV